MIKKSILTLLLAILATGWCTLQGKAIDCPTPASEQNGKMHFTSEKITYEGTCNLLRFTLSESGAFYQNGAKRLSFDSFTLYNSQGQTVNLKSSQFSGNNGKNFSLLLDGVNNTFCCGDWNSENATDDYFEIALPRDLGGAFSFSFVTENTTMNAKAFRIETFTQETTGYTFQISAPEGSNVAVTYNGTAITPGTSIPEEGFDPEAFEANEVDGYTWSIVVDKEKQTVTLVYTKATVIENPEAVVNLANRIGGNKTAKKFLFVLDPSLNSRHEAFIIGTTDKKILIKGTTISALTTGLGWYLNHHANINIAWNSLNERSAEEAYADLSDLPLPAQEETHLCDAQYRYFLNYCTFGYSMTSWTWKRWQQEIDWMALHGINMPLQIVGLEEVWRKFLTLEENGVRKYKYTDAEAKAFVPGPAYTAWWGMNNLEGFGGTGKDGWGGVQDDAWYKRQATLAKNILDRQRELGMQPVLPGFSGMVPSNFTQKTGIATDANGGSWQTFTRPRIIDPTYKGFAEIAHDYYTCLKEVMGESQYYSMDPFHEGGSISSGKYAEAYTAIYEAMEAAKSGSQWVIQQWQWDSNQGKSLQAVPARRLVVLDLFSDGSPAFDRYNGYAPQHAVFCAIPNFGGRSGLMGRLNNLTNNYFSYKAKFESIKGIGAAPEAIEQTPVTYDLLFQLPWMGTKPDLSQWIKQYAKARYGSDNAVVQEAWELLREGVLNYGADGIQGPIEDVWGARPNLNANPASTWGKTLNHAGATYTKARRQMLIDATCKLLSQNEALHLEEGSTYESNYSYDLVEFCGAVMADYAYDLLLGINAAKTAAGNQFRNDATYKARRDAFLSLIADVDVLKGTNLNFRLGKWTQEARDAAAEVTGATLANADWYEFNNARTLITTWCASRQNLNDYSYRSWQGLMKDYYLPRWKYYFDNHCNGCEYFYFEWNWAHGKKHSVGQTSKSNIPLKADEPGYSYSREPEGNTVEESQRLLEKYIVPITLENETYYAYRYLDNDLSAKISIVGKAGGTINLSTFFGELENATISGDFIEGDARDISRIPVKADASDGAHKGYITLEDGTVLSFSVIINPAYMGCYRINYHQRPVFIGYNTDLDNSKNVGYKLINPEKKNPDSAADEIFTIMPAGNGFTLSAQGKYLKSPTLSGWNHVMFSDLKDEAGTFLIEPTSTEGFFKIRSTEDGICYLNNYGTAFGNDKADKPNLSTFSLAVAETYSLTLPQSGIATLCVPFSVVLPDGMQAFDCTATDVVQNEKGEWVCTLQPIASAGDCLKAGTPVFVKATAGIHSLPIANATEANKGSLKGSILKGCFVKPQAGTTDISGIFCLYQSTDNIPMLNKSKSDTDLAANSCWLTWKMEDAERITLQFGANTGIESVTMPEKRNGIYNIEGKRLSQKQKGLNIVNGNKVYVGTK